ncbi:MAG: hypothetical protein AB1467_03395 [Candidatus Diapherotrites archaeon]
MKAKNLLILLLVLILILSPLVSAKTSSSYFHSNDYYVVTFDGEGDAIVSAKLVIDNFTDSSIKKFDLEIPGRAKIYKAVLEPYGYPYPVPLYGAEQIIEKPVAPDYYPYPQYQNQKIDFTYDYTSDSTLVHLELPYSIQPNSQAAIVLLYKILGYAEKDFLGTFNFDFKTVVDNKAALIQNVRVAVNVQEGLYLKGGQAKVEYKPEFFGSGAVSKMASAEVSSSYYRDYSQAIEYSQGEIVKTASNLDPFESFHLKGSYSDNWLLLFLGDIALWIIILIVIGFTAKNLILSKIFWGREEKQFFEPKRTAREKRELRGEEEKGIGFIALVGFLSALGIIAFWWFYAVIVSALFSIVGYMNPALIGLLFFLIGLIVSGALLIGLPIYYGNRKGFGFGAMILMSTVLWLLVLAVVSLIIVGILAPPIYAYPAMAD